jgi:hypothetical protein
MEQRTGLQPAAAAERACSQSRLLEFAFALKHLGNIGSDLLAAGDPTGRIDLVRRQFPLAWDVFCHGRSCRWRSWQMAHNCSMMFAATMT